MTTNATPQILKDYTLRGTNTLRSYAEWGGYPIFYLDAHNSVLCPKCANENDDFDQPIVAADVNWEDPSLYCDHCSTRIESAYADDEA